MNPSDDRKKVIAYRADYGSCYYHRLFLPLKFLAQNHKEDYYIYPTDKMETNQLGVYDLAIFQRQYKAEVFENMLRMQAKGCKIVYEIDDNLFCVEPWNPAHNILGKKAVKDNIKYFLGKVDALFVATENLKEVYEPYCKRIYVLPNSLELSAFHTPPKNSAKTVVGWQGSHTHEKDVALAKSAIERLAREDEVYIKLWRIDLGIPNTYVVPFVPFECFHAMFSQLSFDIGLAPITYINFNRGKSNLKFIEYTAQGAVTIASDFGPYQETIEDGETGLLINNPKDWYDAVMYLVEDLDLRMRLLDNAKNYVLENYDMSKNYKLWKNAIDEIISS